MSTKGVKGHTPHGEVSPRASHSMCAQQLGFYDVPDALYLTWEPEERMYVEGLGTDWERNGLVFSQSPFPPDRTQKQQTTNVY